MVTLFDVSFKGAGSPESTSLMVVGESSYGAMCGVLRCVKDLLLCPHDCVCVEGGSLIYLGERNC